MKILIGILLCAVAAWAGPLLKRLGVPLQAEDDCHPNIGARNFSADPDDCQLFYICDNGWPKLTRCPGDTIWTPDAQRCESPENAVNDICSFFQPDPIEVLPLIDPADDLAQYECNSGDFIAYRAVCDGVEQCDDGSDERNCAEECTPENCELPECKCSNSDIPDGLSRDEIPQIVMVSFDEAVRIEDYNHLYQQIFKKVGASRRREPRSNPDGCPAVGTFFVSHQFTDYAAVQSLYAEGNEIAAHSISKQLPVSHWELMTEDDMADEFASQKMIFEALAGIPRDDIRGLRGAYLQTCGDDAVSMAANNGFVWDSSYSTAIIDPPLFPYSFLRRSTAGCPIPPCPTAPSPIWEMPLVNWLDTNDTLCVNVDSCHFPADKEEAKELLTTNFRRHYNKNKAPFPVNLRADWFYNDGYHNLEAMQEFLDEITALGDVYLVTYSQGLNWVRNPTRLADIAQSGVFDCEYSDREPLCDHPNLCGYYNVTYQPNDDDHPGDRFFHTCAECPEEYPWVKNPLGLTQ